MSGSKYNRRVYDKKYRASVKGIAADKRYSQGKKFKLTQRKYAQSIKGKIHRILITRRYQMKKRNIPVMESELIKQVYARAEELRQWFDVVVDHILPLSKGGVHSASNLQIIYAKENKQKAAKLNYTPKVIFI